MPLSALRAAAHRLCLLVLLACSAPVASSADSAPAVDPVHTVAPPASWVEWTPLPKPSADRDLGDRVVLLADDQISLGPVPERFYRRVSRVLAPGGVDGAGDFSVQFDPSYESVVLHGAWVERDGLRQDRLPGARIDTLRREEGLEQGLIDGELTIHVVLDDVRVGDVVDFAVTVRGENPAFPGHFSTRYWLSFPVPTRLRQIRLLAPAGRALEVRAGPEGYAYERATRDGRLDQRWRWTDRAPSKDEANVPAWHPQGPWLEIADRGTWADVVRRLLPLYEVQDRGAIAALAQELGLEAGDASEAAVLRAIRFVQDEVRYTGLELGAGAYRPHPPHVVAQRRYGDCKDKALLLVALLQHLGLEASPALVDSDELEQVERRLPTPYAFDHVVVLAEVEGKPIWIDATNDHQRGTLATFAQADFGRALVLAPEENALREMAVAAPDSPRVDIEEVIDLRREDGGLAERGSYHIRTVYRGAEADDMRRRFASESAAEVGEAFTDAVADYYPDVEQIEPPTFRDDPEANEVETIERYRLPAIWVPDEEEGGKTASFVLSEIDRAISTPKGVARRAPLDLGERKDVRQRLEVQLDGGWPEEDDSNRLQNDRLDYRGKVWSDGRTLRLEGRLRTLVRHVPGADVSLLRRDLDKLDDYLGYSITYNKGAAEEGARLAGLADWRLLPVVLALLLAWGWVIWSGASASTGPALGMPFRPRASVRAAIDGGRYHAALGLLLLAGLGQAAMEERVLQPWVEGHPLRALGLAAGAAIFAMIAAALFAAVYTGVGRMFGGEGRLREVFIATAWSYVPAIVVLPITLLLLGLYGPQLFVDPQPVHYLPLMLALLAALLPFSIWTGVVWFAALAEAHRISLGRALLAGFAPLVVLLLIGLPIYLLR